MNKRVNLLEGNIFSSLTRLALPIMLTSLIQMAYNMTDMIWIGRMGSSAVAAIGAAGMYLWLSQSLATLARVGGQVKVGHNLGAGDAVKAASFAQSALQIGVVLSIIYGIIMIVFRNPLTSFFGLSKYAADGASIYLLITGGLIIFSTVNQIFTGIITATGNSRTPFVATAVGLVMNIVLDPIMIFGWGFFPAMGIAGAAVATVIAQLVVMLIFVYYAKHDEHLLAIVHILGKPQRDCIKEICRIGMPSAVQSAVFTGISIAISKIVASWGDTAIAVQKVGTQIESISWMTSDGFAAAVNSFVAQNYGADNFARAKKGCHVALWVIAAWGVVSTCLLVFCAAPIFKIFIQEAEALPLGVDYLVILGVSQFLMCIDIVVCGALSGFGKTMAPSMLAIVLTAARIPMALLLSSTALGLNGVWWSITISSNAKGICLFIMITYVFRKMTKKRIAEGKSV